MNWGMYGILILFGIFLILLIINPNLSCFGKRLRSPLYPLLRRKKQRKIETEDYGFSLGSDSGKKKSKAKNKKKTEKNNDSSNFKLHSD